jgi:acyl-CoA thioester hydrolase
MKKVLTYRGAVMSWECDSNRHMNVMYYINKFENGGRNFDLTLGLMDVLDPQTVGIVVLEQNIKYLKECFEDDLLYIESSLLDVGNKTWTVFHEMYNGRTKALVSTMHLVLVLFDKVNRKALPLPAERKAVFLEALGS